VLALRRGALRGVPRVIRGVEGDGAFVNAFLEHLGYAVLIAAIIGGCTYYGHTRARDCISSGDAWVDDGGCSPSRCERK